MWLLAILACDPASSADQAFERGDSSAAIQGYERASALTPAQQQRLALAQLRLGNPDAAQAAMQGVKELSPQGHLVLGILAQGGAEPELALEHFRQGLSIGPMEQLSVNACVLALQVDPQGALSQCQIAIEASPMDPLPKLALAASSLDAGLQAAARELLSALNASTLSPEEARWLVSLWGRAGDPAHACQAGLDHHLRSIDVASACLAAGHPASQAMLEDLDLPQAHALLLRLYVGRAEHATPGPQRVRQMELAQAQLRQVGQLSSGAAVLVDQARLSRLEGDLSRSKALLETACAQRPPELAAWLNLSRVMAEQGEAAGALARLEQAPSFAPMESLALELEMLQLQQSLGLLDLHAAQALAGRCEDAGQAQCLAQSSYVLAVGWAALDLERAALWLQRSVDAGGAAQAQRALGEARLLPVLQSPSLARWDLDPDLAGIRAAAMHTRPQIPSTSGSGL